MQARMKHPAMILPDATAAIQALTATTQQGGVPATTLGLVHLRARQLNGCSVCVDSGSRHAATTNFFNRLNVTTRQVVGAWG